MSRYYYEAHVTVAPVFDEALSRLKLLAKRHHFRVADLILRKDARSKPEPHREDSFCTSRSRFYEAIAKDTREFVAALKTHGFDVYRYKIEDTLVDSDVSDELKLGVSR